MASKKIVTWNQIEKGLQKKCEALFDAMTTRRNVLRDEWVALQKEGKACGCGGSKRRHNPRSWDNGWPEWYDCSDCAERTSEQIAEIQKAGLWDNVEKFDEEHARLVHSLSELKVEVVAAQKKQQIKKFSEVVLAKDSKDLQKGARGFVENIIIKNGDTGSYVLCIVRTPENTSHAVYEKVLRTVHMTPADEEASLAASKKIIEAEEAVKMIEQEVVKDSLFEAYGLAHGFPLISGTEKQRAWANKIRQTIFEKNMKKPAEERMKLVEKTKKWTASHWIENREGVLL